MPASFTGRDEPGKWGSRRGTERTGRVRILIAGPPKTGNMWLKCLLSQIYGLDWLKPGEYPERHTAERFIAWVEGGGFRDNTIFHQHYKYTPELADAADRGSIKLVSIIRDPYDAFVSTYFTMRRHALEGTGNTRRQEQLFGDEFTADALPALRDGGYLSNLRKARGWVESKRSVVVRYEDLHADPVGTLTAVTARLGPAGPDKIAAAVEYCSADAMRQRTTGGAKHVRTATVGDSHNHLTEEHLAIFRGERYARLLRALGYEVR